MDPMFWIVAAIMFGGAIVGGCLVGYLIFKMWEELADK